MRTIDLAPLPLSDLESHLDEVAVRRLRGGVDAAHGLLGGRTIWTVTPSAAAGSGPAEIVAPLVGYARGLGIDARWLTLDAPAEFLTISSRLHAALHDARATIAFSGAGTSAYVGDILAPAIQRHSRAHCLTTASTDLVAQPAGKLPRDAHGFLFAFARSGNSPESVASLEKAAAVAPELVPVAVTCNDRGALAEHCRNGHGYCCQMPPETHDESFVMTSSFSTMTLFTAAGLLAAWCGDGDVVRATARSYLAWLRTQDE